MRDFFARVREQFGAGLTKAKVAIGGAFSLADETNEAYASIDSTAGVNVAGKLNVHADAQLPMPLLIRFTEVYQGPTAGPGAEGSH